VSLVSVVIPCRNYGRFLGDAIDSVLAQDHHEVEVIVVDYGSTDETSDVIARYPQVRHLRQPNHGVAVARNAGLEAGSGTLHAEENHPLRAPGAMLYRRMSSSECVATPPGPTAARIST
jgi:glycosyltransferase involved in cell wall biosynthesis